MLHPNTLAVNYVWDIFKKVWLSPDSENIMIQVDRVQKGLQHKALFPDTQAHQTFLRQLEQRKEELKINYGIEF